MKRAGRGKNRTRVESEGSNAKVGEVRNHRNGEKQLRA